MPRPRGPTRLAAPTPSSRRSRECKPWRPPVAPSSPAPAPTRVRAAGRPLTAAGRRHLKLQTTTWTASRRAHAHLSPTSAAHARRVLRKRPPAPSLLPPRRSVTSDVSLTSAAPALGVPRQPRVCGVGAGSVGQPGECAAGLQSPAAAARRASTRFLGCGPSRLLRAGRSAGVPPRRPPLPSPPLLRALAPFRGGDPACGCTSQLSRPRPSV